MAMNVTRKEFDDLSNKVDKLGSDVKSSYTAIGNALAGIEDHNSRLEAKMDAGFARLDSKMDAGFAKSDSKMDAGFARQDANTARLESRLDATADRLDATAVRLDVTAARLDFKIDAGFAGMSDRFDRIEALIKGS
jgi:hypothetical protein